MMVAFVTTTYGTTSPTLKTSDHVYLSDISYVQDKSFASSGNSILLDKNQSSDLITLNINGKETPFLKGICAWATSEIVYDLREYDFDYFTSYIGVDISEQSNYFNTGAKFYIYTSNDGEKWEEQYQSDTLYGWSNALFIKLNIKDVNYLKLVADDNSDNWWSNWYDETVFADAKLIKEDYVEDTTPVDFIKTVEEYDEKLNEQSVDQEITGEYELTLLQREFVKNVGYNILQQFVKYSDDYYNVVSWLMNDVENLRIYIIGGEPDGGYIESLRILSQLYSTYQDDLNNEEITENGTVLKDLYRRMMITLSLTHSTNCGLWAGGMTSNPDDPNNSNAVVRYEIYKKMHQEGKLDNKIFESLNVEEMRFVMNNIIDDEEIEWLNAYTTEKDSKNPYSYITYTFGYDYSKSEYYDPENYDKWNQKYNLSDYNITYQTGYPKLWIVFEEGGVCGALSKTGSNIWGSYGVPSTVVSQPGHAAYIYYSLDSNGNGIWNLYNDISGWQQSGKTEKLNIRMPNGWGSGSYASQYPVSYILLAQGALNDFENYEKSEEILLLANTYQNNEEELYKIYRKALDVQPLNFDAWYGLVNLYQSDETKSDEEIYVLAQEIATTLKYYPLPMYDLLKILEPSIESTKYNVSFNLLLTRTLTEATQATASDTIQQSAVRAVANYLLGNMDTELATFSFDGENAGAIVLGSRFDGVGVTWEYSLDNQQTWTQTQEHKLQLIAQEIEKITAENDILVHIVGANYEDDNIYKIDITKGNTPTNLYNNDLENKVIGVTDIMEWRYNQDDDWTSFKDQTPDLTGNKTVMVRIGATGTYLPSDSLTYSFTEDNQSDTQKYIPIANLSVFDVSSEEPGHSAGAQNAIDGNINTMWHSNWNGNDSDRYITIKLNEPAYLSALQYVPRQSGNNGRIKNGQVLVSMDGETWTEVATITNWANNADAKTVVFNESTKCQYIKLVATQNYGDGRNFITAAMINLFEDVTKNMVPTAEIVYDIEKITNLDVTATLVNPSTEITITNNDGKDSYVFTQNGNFTFEFIDKNGNKGTATAVVNWIDKTPPTATISYDITEETNQPVTATISNFSEKVTITNNSGSDTYTFVENGTFEFEFVDEAGNIGTAIATVSWIQEEESETPDPGDEQEPTEPTDPDENPDKEQKPNETPDLDEQENPSDTSNQEEQGIVETPEIEQNQTTDESENDPTVSTGKLPQTGFNNTIILIILVGLIALAVIFYIRMRKISKKEKQL